jgi:hypothetical protein
MVLGSAVGPENGEAIAANPVNAILSENPPPLFARFFLVPP